MNDIQYVGIIDNLINYLDLCEYYELGDKVINKNINNWLHFIIDGKETYVSMMNICNEVSWDDLNNKGLIFGDKDSSLITLNGKQYKVRSPKGIVSDILDDVIIKEIRYYKSINKIHPELRDSEFNQLLYGFIDHQLVDEEITWCQESYLPYTESRIIRGYFGPSYLIWYTSSSVYTDLGWRAIIENV